MRGVHNNNYNILGSILRSSNFGKLPPVIFKTLMSWNAPKNCGLQKPTHMVGWQNGGPVLGSFDIRDRTVL